MRPITRSNMLKYKIGCKIDIKPQVNNIYNGWQLGLTTDFDLDKHKYKL